MTSKNVESIDAIGISMMSLIPLMVGLMFTAGSSGAAVGIVAVWALFNLGLWRMVK